MVGTVSDWAGKTFENLQSFGALSSAIISVLGLLATLSTKTITEFAIRRHQQRIKAESGENFSVTPGRTYTTSGDNINAPSSHLEGLTRVLETLQPDGELRGENRPGTRFRTTDSLENIGKPKSSKIAKNQVRKRLEDIIEERERQQTVAKWSRITSRTLTFGQYIIGAMLATSLAQSTISRTWLSIFGLLVILCSATKQHFHVDENAQSADVRFHKLRSLVRYAQDQIAILEIKSINGEDRTDAYIALLNEITQSLGQTESSYGSYLFKAGALSQTKDVR